MMQPSPEEPPTVDQVSNALVLLRDLLGKYGHWHQAATAERALLMAERTTSDELLVLVSSGDVWGGAGSLADVNLRRPGVPADEVAADNRAFFSALERLGAYIEANGALTPGIEAVLRSVREFLTATT